MSTERINPSAIQLKNQVNSPAITDLSPKVGGQNERTEALIRHQLGMYYQGANSTHQRLGAAVMNELQAQNAQITQRNDNSKIGSSMFGPQAHNSFISEDIAGATIIQNGKKVTRTPGKEKE